ncbi:odorant receptor 4-like isoform X1 [Nomia melanderi]|uniref:odorant receptor 4-like isoform X1 n=1 Tax=Nomia melanderi TaxID=2448451 RepID=UPI003FCE5590
MSGKHTPDDLVKPAKNSNYAHDIDYALGWCRRMLRLIGVWSLIEQRTSWLEKVLSFLLRTVILGVQLFFIVPITLHICQTEKNPMMKIKLLGPPSNCAFSVIKFFYLVLRGTAFRSCIEHMENDWRRVKDPQHRSIMLKQISISRNLIALCLFFIYAAGISYYTIIPLLAKLQRKGNHTGRRLMHPGYDRFFDVRSSPVFELIYSAHCASGFFRFNVTAAAFTLAVIFVTHICGQMQIQMLRLRELCNRKDKETVRGQLSVIIHDHVEVLRFSKIARGAFIEIVLIEIFGSTFLLCLVEYCCLLEWKASNAIAMTTYTIYMTSFTFNAMIFCYIGEILTEQCSQIGFAGYDVDWYNLPGKRGCDFILLNMISLYPPKLSGGKIIELSLNTFSVILKTSVVYLNLLRTITTF